MTTTAWLLGLHWHQCIFHVLLFRSNGEGIHTSPWYLSLRMLHGQSRTSHSPCMKSEKPRSILSLVKLKFTWDPSFTQAPNCNKQLKPAKKVIKPYLIFRVWERVYYIVSTSSYTGVIMPWLCVDHMIQQAVWPMGSSYPDPLAKSRPTGIIQTHWQNPDPWTSKIQNCWWDTK